jgi:hypothetical protein
MALLDHRLAAGEYRSAIISIASRDRVGRIINVCQIRVSARKYKQNPPKIHHITPRDKI